MLIYGKNVLQDMDKKRIRKVYCSRKDYLDYLQKNKIHYEYVKTNYLDKLVNGVHQGIVIDVFDYEYKNIEDIEGNLIVVLDHIEDPHNLGSIIRTCACAGVKTIIIPKDRSAKINDTVVKVSAGTVDKVNIIMVTNITNALNYLKNQDYYIYAADADGEDYQNCVSEGKKVLIIGNEGNGISNIVKKNSDFLISIKMSSNVDSLNAGVAAGILIFGMRGTNNE